MEIEKVNYRQGDVILKKEVDIDLSASTPTSTEMVVLAEGEMTGHRHVIPQGAHLFKFNDEMYAKIVEPFATLRHEEHGPINLPGEKTFEIVIKREYFRDQERKVID